MVTVVEKLPQEGMRKLELELLDKEYKCPTCGKKRSFFSYSERICSVCGSDIPPVDKMMTDELQRKLYHFDGSSTLMDRFLSRTV